MSDRYKQYEEEDEETPIVAPAAQEVQIQPTDTEILQPSLETGLPLTFENLIMAKQGRANDLSSQYDAELANVGVRQPLDSKKSIGAALATILPIIAGSVIAGKRGGMVGASAGFGAGKGIMDRVTAEEQVSDAKALEKARRAEKLAAQSERTADNLSLAKLKSDANMDRAKYSEGQKNYRAELQGERVGDPDIIAQATQEMDKSGSVSVTTANKLTKDQLKEVLDKGKITGTLAKVRPGNEVHKYIDEASGQEYSIVMTPPEGVVIDKKEAGSIAKDFTQYKTFADKLTELEAKVKETTGVERWWKNTGIRQDLLDLKNMALNGRDSNSRLSKAYQNFLAQFPNVGSGFSEATAGAAQILGRGGMEDKLAELSKSANSKLANFLTENHLSLKIKTRNSPPTNLAQGGESVPNPMDYDEGDEESYIADVLKYKQQGGS